MQLTFSASLLFRTPPDSLRDSDKAAWLKQSTLWYSRGGSSLLIFISEAKCCLKEGPGKSVLFEIRAAINITKIKTSIKIKSSTDNGGYKLW